MRSIFKILFLIFLLYFPLKGQKLAIKHFTPELGLPFEEICDIKQDPKGNIWVAGRKAVLESDGVNWQIYDYKNGLLISSFSRLAVDDSGNVWAASQYFDNIAFAKLDNGKCSIKYPFLNAFSKVKKLVGFLFLKSIPLVAIYGEGVFVFENEEWRKIGGLQTTSIYSIKKVDSLVYIFTRRGIKIWDGQKISSFKQEIFGDKQIVSALFSPDSKELRWFLTPQGLFIYEKGNLRKVGRAFDIEEPVTSNFSLAGPYFGKIFFGNEKELFSYDTLKKRLRLCGSFMGFLHGGANALLVDKFQNLWLGNYYGLAKLESFSFRIFSGLHSAVGRTISAIEKLEDGKIIIANELGFIVIDTRKLAFKHFYSKELYYASIIDLERKGDGEIYFASPVKGFGLLKWNGAKSKIKWLWKRGNEKAKSLSVLRRGKDLFLLYDFVLIKQHNGKQEKVVKTVKYSNFRKLFLDRKKRLIIASTAGIFQETSEGFSRILGSLPNSNNVYAFLDDEKYGKLVGTAAGVFKVDADTLKKIRLGDSYLDVPVYFILKGRKHELWFGTNRGLYRFTGKNLLHYSTADGLPGSEANRDAALVDDNGNLWFGFEGGMAEFLYEYDKLGKVPPPFVEIEKIESKEKRFIYATNSKLHSTDNELIFHFHAITQEHPSLLRYFVRLENYDKEWLEMKQTPGAFIRYTNLPSGNYVFKVKAKDYWGNISNVAESWKITILKPFYKGWKFTLVAAFSVLAFVIIISMLFLKTRREKILEREIKKATEEIRRSEELYRQMFRENLSVLLQVDLDTGKILDANDAAAAFYGVSLEELKKMRMGEIDEFFDTMIETIKKGLGAHGYRSKHKLPNGDIRYVEVYENLIRVDDKEFVYISVNDITEEEKIKSELEMTEQKYRAIIERMQDALFMVKDGKIVFANNAVYKLAGYSKEELIGKDFTKFIHPEDRSIVIERYRKALEGEETPEEYEFRILKKNGEIARVRLNVGRITLEGEIYSVGTLKDVTEYLKTREALKSSEQRYRELLENSAVGIYRRNTEGKIEIANSVLVKMLGFSSLDELENLTPEEVNVFFNYPERIFQDLLEKGEIQGYERELVRKDGEKIYVRESVKLFKDEAGKILFWEGIIEDITSSRKTLELLRESEAKNTKILEALPDPIIEITSGGVILNIRKIEQFGGYSASEMLGKNIENFIPENLREDFKKALTEALLEDKITKTVMVWEDNGKEIYLEIRFVKVESDLVFALVRDVTETVEYEHALIKAKEMAELTNELENKFLAHVSYGIRTPLTAILGYIQLIEEECKEKVSQLGAHEFADIKNSIGRLLKTIDSMVKSAEIRAGVYEKREEVFALEEVFLQEILPRYKNYAERKGLRLLFENKAGKVLVKGDKFSIGQIFDNLVSNAVKYTVKGKVEISLELSEENVIVRIEDTGIGISKEFLPYIFESFTEKKQPYNRQFEITDLGLPLVKKYAELNNIEIRIESEEGKGTKVTLIMKKFSDTI